MLFTHLKLKRAKNNKRTISVFSIIVMSITVLLVGLSISFLSVWTKNEIDNSLILIVSMLLLALLISGKINLKRGNNEAKIDNIELKYGTKNTALFLIILVLSILTGTILGKFLCPKIDKIFKRNTETIKNIRNIKNELSGKIYPENPKKFNFIVLGDTRTELYLPWDKKNEKKIKEIIKERFNKLELDEIDVELDKKSFTCIDTSESLTYYGSYSKSNFPDSLFISVTKDTIARYDKRGHQAIYEKVWKSFNPYISQFRDSCADFAIHTGDLVLWSDKADNEYWTNFSKTFYDKLGGNKKRFFPVIGNHEYWKDSTATHFFEKFKHLKSSDNQDGCHYYWFKYGNSIFVFLCSGHTRNNKTFHDCWNCHQAGFEEQKEWLNKTANAVVLTAAFRSLTSA